MLMLEMLQFASSPLGILLGLPLSPVTLHLPELQICLPCAGIFCTQSKTCLGQGSPLTPAVVPKIDAETSEENTRA